MVVFSCSKQGLLNTSLRGLHCRGLTLPWAEPDGDWTWNRLVYGLEGVKGRQILWLSYAEKDEHYLALPLRSVYLWW